MENIFIYIMGDSNDEVRVENIVGRGKQKHLNCFVVEDGLIAIRALSQGDYRAARTSSLAFAGRSRMKYLIIFQFLLIITC